MIGILIVAHDKLAESLVGAVTHVLGARPAQFEAFGVSAADDPLMLLPRARERVAALDTGDGVLIFSDIYGATPCNLVGKLLVPARIEGVAGVNLPMLIKLAGKTSSSDLLAVAQEMREHGRNAIWVASDFLRAEKTRA